MGGGGGVNFCWTWPRPFVLVVSCLFPRSVDLSQYLLLVNLFIFVIISHYHCNCCGECIKLTN